MIIAFLPSLLIVDVHYYVQQVERPKPMGLYGFQFHAAFNSEKNMNSLHHLHDESRFSIKRLAD